MTIKYLGIYNHILDMTYVSKYLDISHFMSFKKARQFNRRFLRILFTQNIKNIVIICHNVGTS